jgi:hypothetical protein
MQFMTGSERRGIVIQDRDRHLLRELSIMRVIDRDQAKCVAPFGSTTRANVRLLALTRAGLLRRFFLGSARRAVKAIYSPSKKGADLTEVPYRGIRRKSDEILVADFFVTHQLSINEIYLIIKYRPIPFADVTFGRWVNFTEPVENATPLIPDGYAEIMMPARTIAAFLEIDLGHESLAVWKRKVQMYIQFATSGNFSRRFGQPQFRTLAVATSLRRIASLRMTTAAVTDKIFWFTTFELINRDGFWSPIWQRPTGDDRKALI